VREPDKLRLYLSVLVLETAPGDDSSPNVPDLLTSFTDVLGLERGHRTVVDRVDTADAGQVSLGFVHYQERKQARWTYDLETVDVVNHLLLVGARNRHVAVLVTDSARLPAIIRGVGEQPLASLRLVPEGTLNWAFVNGDARTLWLSGIHSRTSVKADSKVLIGRNLRDALNPLDDQTYYYTAVRSATKLGDRSTIVGLAPRRARVWTGASRQWQEFASSLRLILKAVEDTETAKKSSASPIEVLAAPAPSSKGISRAFDAWIKAPETAEGPDTDRASLETVERWSNDATFGVTGTSGPNLKASVFVSGRRAGRLDFRIDASKPSSVTVQVTSNPLGGREDEIGEIVELCSDRRWLQVRYESGHTLSDGAIYMPRYRDVRFAGWRWLSFDGFNITKEKPVRADKKTFDAEKIGEQNSLFCWVFLHWPLAQRGRRRRAWLACDDGSMEMADFIYFDDAPGHAVLALIHVKGSHSPNVNRGISVSDYEVVVSQAQKNLRHLDGDAVQMGLAGAIDKKMIAKKVWHNGRLTDRDSFVAAMKSAGDNYERQVVILQPRVAKSTFDKARKELTAREKTSNSLRLQQLETLLVAAEASCKNLGASLTVLAEDDTRRLGK
jgi:hypothetical protein